MKTKLYPVDKMRIRYLDHMNVLRNNFWNHLCNTSEKENLSDLLKTKKDQVKKFVSSCSGFELSQFARSADFFTDGNSMMQANLITANYDNRLHAFHFEDKTLVDNIINSQFSKVPITSIKLPFESTVIGLPYKIDKNGHKFDVITVSKTTAEMIEVIKPTDKIINKNNSTSTVFWITLINSDNNDASWCALDLDRYTHIGKSGFIKSKEDDDDEWGESAKEAAEMFLLVCKFLAFLVSPSCNTKEIYRRAKKKSPEQVKKSFRRLNMITFNKNNTKYNYEDDSSGSRTVGVRHAVIGHFKSFTKGSMAGRILWCPPHWRGPEIGEKIIKDHLVK